MEQDDVLLKAARAGDSEALERLLERHQNQVYRFGMRMCRDPEDAQDVLQDTLLAMARGIRDFRGASSLSTWIYTIARSFCIKKRRRHKSVVAQLPESSLSEAKEIATSSLAPDEVLAGKQIEQALTRAIASLDPTYREVLLLRDVEGLTASEVAEVVGASVQAVKSRLHRARLMVREVVGPLLGVPRQPEATSSACPDVLTLYSKHLEGEITANLCAEMERHLHDCARCKATCDSLKQTLALCATASNAEVPVKIQTSVRAAIRDFVAAARS